MQNGEEQGRITENSEEYQIEFVQLCAESRSNKSTAFT